MEQATRMQDRTQQRTREIGPLAGHGVEATSAWLEANQHVWRLWRGLAQLSAETARENVRFFWELQSSAIDVLTAPAAGWIEMQKEAAGWCEKTMRHGVEGIQRAFGALAEGDGAGRRRTGRDLEAIRSQWPHLRGRIRQQWDRLTDEELEQIQGNPERLVGKLQEHYGRSREQAEQDLDRWLEQQRLPKAS
jgi:uncharacterized protein YjbJ (UPF0337 family)